MNNLLTNGPGWNVAWKRMRLAGAMALLVTQVGWASPKHRDVALPDFVWQARSVVVVILPDSPEPMDDPFANHKAQENVEKALLEWGRFRLDDPLVADLVIAVRKGTGKVANPTISRGPMDSRPGTVEATGDSIHVGIQRGGTQGTGAETGPTPGMEVGASDDTLEVFQSGNNAPVWKYSAKDSLKAPGMTAVGKFREAVEAAEQAAKQKQQSQQKTQKKTP